MLPIEEACYWHSEFRSEPSPALAEDVFADIGIIGAGFTGLWTALFLKEIDPSVDVVVVEKGIAGYGGSGRNAGILGETIDHSHALAVAHFGLDEARKLAEFGRKNLDEMSGFLVSENIDCDWEQTGRLLVALSPAQLEEARKSMEVGAKLGVEGVKWLDEASVQEEIHSPLYIGGVHSSGGGILNPLKLVHGLKLAAIRKGVRIFERTPVASVEEGKIKTPTGTARARRVILATDAYSHHLFPSLLNRFIPLYDYILVSEPLTADQRAAMGWRNRQGVTDGRAFFNYYRLTADNRVLWGTSEAVYYPSNRVDESCDHSERHYADLRESFRKHFPQLAEVRFPFAWGGPIASTTRLTPFFGTLQGGKLLYGLGYTGHGIGSTRIAGKILSHMALDRPHELLDLSLVRKKPFPYPPEPFRGMAVNAVTNALRKTDAGSAPGLILRSLDLLGIGFSS